MCYHEQNPVRLWLCKYFYQSVRQKWGTVYWILEEEKAFDSVAKNVAELTSIGWKVEFISNELEYLPEEFSKQCTDMKLDFVFVVSRNLEEREKLKKELLSKIWANKIIKAEYGVRECLH